MKRFFALGIIGLVFLSSATTEEFRLPPATNMIRRNMDANFICYIRIWGWSENGKVALSMERFETSAWSGPSVQFYIINLITNEIVVYLDLTERPHFTTWSWAFTRNREYFENYILNLHVSKKDEIITALKNYEIIEHHTEFSAFPIVIGYYTFTVFTRNVEDEQDRMETMFDIIVSKNGREKVIRTETNFDGADRVSGYFKSPFESRILIITEEFLSAHGGISYRFTGFCLDDGFN